MKVVALAAAVAATLAGGSVQAVYSTLDELKWDENGRLEKHYLLYQSDAQCRDVMTPASMKNPPEFREMSGVSGPLAELLFANLQPKDESLHIPCPAICIDKGSRRDLVQHVIPEKMFLKTIPNHQDDIAERADWIQSKCQKAEFGFINWTPNDLVIYWVNSKGARIKVGDLGQREVNTQWQTTVLGHKFDVIDETGVEPQLIASFVVKNDAFNVLGDAGSRIKDKHNVTSDVKQTLEMEWHRHNRVTRSFTQLGFHKGRLPHDVWNSMSTYYYNNRNNKVREEWDSKGLYVNWWDVNAYMIGMPWGLKTYWQSRLKLLVEAWSGTDLELTDIYGMRRYEDGARLLTHVDREATHAASLIINVAQGGIREHWPVEIYDHANRLHEVIMDEGDIVYYESAKCLHGRMRPLRGSFYVNLFAHYRPTGDAQWFTRQNPEGTPAQLLALGACKDAGAEGGQRCDADGTEVEMPFLSKTLATLSGPSSLMQHWQDVTPSNEEVEKVLQYHQQELLRLQTLREQSARELSGQHSQHSEL